MGLSGRVAEVAAVLGEAVAIVTDPGVGGSVLDAVPGPAAPMVAIPSTAGTGSEVTLWAIVANAPTHAIEGYAARSSNPIGDALVTNHMEGASADGGDMPAAHDHVPILAEIAMMSSDNPDNPVPMDKPAYKALFREALAWPPG
jgi:alcohol dehydrogenase class IV